jgi:hypothetical protein
MLIGAEAFEIVAVFNTIVELLADDWNSAEMFLGEAMLAAGLVHQNIVQICKLGRLEKQYYFAFEYANGFKLEHFPHLYCAPGEDSAPSMQPAPRAKIDCPSEA